MLGYGKHLSANYILNYILHTIIRDNDFIFLQETCIAGDITPPALSKRFRSHGYELIIHDNYKGTASNVILIHAH